MTELLIQNQRQRCASESSDEGLAIGQWYWVKGNDSDEDEKHWLGCITHIGSNYAELTAINGGSCRVHFTEFIDTCTPEPDAEKIIASKILKYQQEAQLLMSKVQDITRSLAITPRQELNSGEEIQALALISSNQQPVGEYKQALIKARDETLPKLFEKIKEANSAMGEWMKAPLIRMKAELEILKPAIKMIEARVFNVELYAGLIEQVEQIKDGEPAAISEPVHIFQRRAYMDEECLAQYETGGMEFKDIEAFDKWLINPQNLRRLLPFPRCILTFQVRRNSKEREAISLSDFIRIYSAEQQDKLTFLYLRNGQQVFRLSTRIEFDEQLFPDIERSKLDGAVYAAMSGSRIRELISESAYLDMIERDRAAREKHNREVARVKKKDRWKFGSYWGLRREDYIQWSPDGVYYDDIAEYVKKQIDTHNRLVLVLQGLFDRSPVFHPHPPYQLWTQEGFSQAIKLIYDDSRALTVGDKPDFEVYRAYLNSSLKPGDITVGQEIYWEQVEAGRYNRECRRNWKITNHQDVDRYSPYGNPGPGRLAVVQSVSKKGCIYKWARERTTYSRYSDNTPIPCSLTVPTSALINCSAYMAGEFQQFYKDPRTRSEYLKWSYLLLTAEEYSCGLLGENGKRKAKADIARINKEQGL